MMVWLWVLVIGFVVLVGGMIGFVVVLCWLWVLWYVLWRVVGVVEVVVWRRKSAQSTA